MRTALALRNAAAIGFGIVMAATSLAGCGSSAGTDNPNEPITLTINLFGDFGYKDLYTQYQTAHPNITIKENVTDYGTHHQNLQAHLLAGAGTADIEAIEIGQVAGFQPQAAKFANFLDYGVDTSLWTDQKWKAGASADGKTVFGVGTDVGGLAMCYRSDLFKKAGLPTDREAVSALWPTWQAYLDTGKKFQAGTKGKTKFLDSATNTYNSILMQGSGIDPGYTYFDRNNNFVMDTNPAIKTAWDTTNTLLAAGLSANLKSFTPEWNAGFKNGAFATIACPAWMTGYIKGQAGDSGSGKWDIASVPGGSGSWGGSFLAVPTQSKHQAEAVALAKFLSSPAGQLTAFTAAGNLPSSPQDHQNPALLDFKNPYFSNAPVGSIFIKGAASLKPVYLGAKNQAVRDSIENDLRAVEQGKKTSAAGWAQAIKDGKAAAGV